MRRRWILRVLLPVTLCLVGIAGAAAWRAHGGLQRAHQLASFGLWPDARVELSRYLWLHPAEPQAHLAMAEALLKDEELSADQAVSAASWHLRRIPDSSPFAAMARAQEGRMELFVLNRPWRAEALFRHAHDVNPQAIDPHFMIWKLYDLTGRSHLAEADFWRVYDVSPVAARGTRLREWYMSQFFPATANPTLDQLMGVSSEKSTNAARTEGDRFVRFRNSEPDGPVGYAALARWFQHEGDSKFARQILDEALDKVEEPTRDPFFLATQISVLIELGEFDGLEAALDSWPQPREGYEYWVARGSVAQEVKGDFAAAADAYGQALANWPGQVDWRTLNRRATCLMRLKREDELVALRERIKVVESLTDDKLHRSLRQALGSIEDPDKLGPVVDFYERLLRPREAEGWKEYVAWLRSAALREGAAKPDRPDDNQLRSP